jgi:hypothetical protein
MQPMGHYATLGAVIMRSFGLLIIVYSVPVLLWGILRVVSGAPHYRLRPNVRCSRRAIFGSSLARNC